MRDFHALAKAKPYTPLPEDWFLGLADVEDSSGLIDAGKYKLVNTIGAAVISAQMNAFPEQRFPFVFGGDGAAFAMPGEWQDQAALPLDAVRKWALREFDIVLRAAIVPVSEIRSNKRDIFVARHGPSTHVDYAMFAGGGVSWAEREMKRGQYHVADTCCDEQPDLTGLSCRWTPIKAINGQILSVVATPRAGADPLAIQNLMSQLVSITEGLDRGGHPVTEKAPRFRWLPEGLEYEARSRDGTVPLWRRKLTLYLETFIGHFFFRTGLKADGFDPEHYIKTASANSDFRKFEDALLMTIDSDQTTRDALTECLQKAQDEGLINYGISEQESALMTCIIPSVTSDDHIHFVDGASGGYATAASLIKKVRFQSSPST
ncbi:MAG: DUF3095 domain-containing protein [Rhizobiaceae bacterium]